MTIKSNSILASSVLALTLCLSSCGKKEEPEPAPDPAAGAQSTHGKMLEAARKTAEEANARTERVKEATGQ